MAMLIKELKAQSAFCLDLMQRLNKDIQGANAYYGMIEMHSRMADDVIRLRRELNAKANLTELNKLQTYLDEHGFLYKRIDGKVDGFLDRHQILVYSVGKDGEKHWLWDAISHYGSYGYEQGLLEIMGTIANGDVEGWLTAQDVIERIERDGGN